MRLPPSWWIRTYRPRSLADSFALADAAGILSGFLLFSLLAFCPGYLAAHSFNLWQFRSRTTAFKIAVSVPLSIGIGPILTFLLGSISDWRTVWWFYLSVTATVVVLLVRARLSLDQISRRAFAIGLGWSFFAAIWLLDWQWASRLYFPIYAFDYATRAAMVHSLAAFGLPAQTPFFSPGHPVALHYHYLWLLQCAIVHWIAPALITARCALIAGTIWCGLGLMCVSALAMRLLLQSRSWIVIALLTVTGLDIIPALLILLANRLHLLGILPPSVEWWNEQVDGWLYTALWQPHYTCALIACVTGFLILWQSKRLLLSLPAALCFATAVGSGSFVALVFAAFLAIWTVVNWRESKLLLVTGAIALLLSFPYLASLRAPAQNVGGASLLQFTIRAFSPVQLPPLLNLVALPLNYFLELGFFAACIWTGYRRRLTRLEGTLMLMAGVSMLICTFVKSVATPNNDLGWRGFLVAQFALLILSAGYLERNAPTRGLKVMLLLGLLGTGYDLLLNRFFPILSDLNDVPRLNWLALDQNLGIRTMANRQAFSWLHLHSNQTATIAVNPDVDAVDIFSGLYADRRIVAGDRTCTIGFGGSAAECKPLYQLGANLFAGRADPAACSALGADFLIVKATDPLFQHALPWSFSNQFVRIFRCSRSR